MQKNCRSTKKHKKKKLQKTHLSKKKQKKNEKIPNFESETVNKKENTQSLI